MKASIEERIKKRRRREERGEEKRGRRSEERALRIKSDDFLAFRTSY